MKNHKGNNRFNDITSKNEHNNGSMQQKKDGFNKPEKQTEPGKGPMHHPNKDVNSSKNSNEEKEQGKSKYFGNYNKKCDDCDSYDCHCK